MAATDNQQSLSDSTDTRAVTLGFAAIVAAMLPAVLDQTILATALPTIAGELGSVTDLSWVVTAYVVAAAATTPLWGKLGDRLGRKRMLELALAVFVVSSALCAAAQDITQLIVTRVAQGVAAGGLMTLAMAVVGDLVAPRERGRYQGYIAATFAVATIVGPLIGGVLVESASWRWVFLVNLPLGAVALAGLALRLPAPERTRPEQPLDTLGAGLLAGATSAFMLTCIWGGDRFGWGSPEILGLIGVTVLLAAALVSRERRAADPIVPLHLLRTRPVAVASAALFLATAALFAITVFVPLFLQTATGASPTEAGLLLVPAMLGITVSTTLSGRSIARTGRYKRFPVAGLRADERGARAAGCTRRRAVAARDRHRPRRLRVRLRDGRTGADRRRAEQRRAARARRRHRHDRLLPRRRRSPPARRSSARSSQPRPGPAARPASSTPCRPSSSWLRRLPCSAPWSCCCSTSCRWPSGCRRRGGEPGDDRDRPLRLAAVRAHRRRDGLGRRRPRARAAVRPGRPRRRARRGPDFVGNLRVIGPRRPGAVDRRRARPRRVDGARQRGLGLRSALGAAGAGPVRRCLPDRRGSSEPGGAGRRASARARRRAAKRAASSRAGRGVTG